MKTASKHFVCFIWSVVDGSLASRLVVGGLVENQCVCWRSVVGESGLIWLVGLWSVGWLKTCRWAGGRMQVCSWSVVL